MYPNLNFDADGLLSVYVDGSCRRNGKPDAQAGIGVWFNHNNTLNLSAPVKGKATNNEAEIQAATKAIEIADSIGIKKLRIKTDSYFLVRCMTAWIENWKQNNWETAAKKPVQNKESLIKLDSAVSRMEKVEWEHVAGHSNIAGNEEADALANEGATLYRNSETLQKDDPLLSTEALPF